MSDLILSTHESAALFGRPAAIDLRPAGAEQVRSSLLGSVRIDPRHNGPRRSANGGFAAGAIARHIDADVVTVRLRRRIPLGRTLYVSGDGAHGCLVHHGRRLIAEARPGSLVPAALPAAPAWDDALAAREAHPFVGQKHPLSDCVVCSPHRRDGMHITPGPVRGRPELLAAPWSVDSRDAVGGTASYATVWAAMDCPSYPAAALRDRELCLLGTMTALVERRPRVGENLVVYSWTRARQGRRHETSVAIVDSRGQVIARADSTWIALRRQRVARWASRFR
ncbi:MULTISPECIES: hypothetical protein [Microbacterium]|uniref:hypothetical protein n=1 Tax=Microbacterium TaxID=33882 RepID=UPI00146DF559|nr:MULTISPECIES: hypothetical protein [Microbacterium]